MCDKINSSCFENIDPCGCKEQIDSKCIFYNNETLSCINVLPGSDLESILKSINNKICELNPTTQIIYSVVSADNNIVVTPFGTNPKVFKVGLSPAFLNKITILENNANNVNNFISGLNFQTTTPGMSGSFSGNTLTVNYTPSAPALYSGLIVNSLAPVSVFDSGNPVTFNYDLTSYSPQTGDVLKISGVLTRTNDTSEGYFITLQTNTAAIINSTPSTVDYTAVKFEYNCTIKGSNNMNVTGVIQNYTTYNAGTYLRGIVPDGMPNIIVTGENIGLHYNNFNVVFQNSVYTELSQFQIEIIRKL